MNWADPDVKSRTDSREGLPDIIPPTIGTGISFEVEGITYTTVSDYPRTLEVSVTTFKGISFGAVHYYGKIKVSEPPMECIEDGKPVRHYYGGYWDRHKPKEMLEFSIEIQRPLTPHEIEHGTEEYGNDRWLGYKAGDLVHAFDTEEDLRAAIVECVKARFTGDWLIHMDDFENAAYNIPYSNIITVAELK